MLFADVGPSLRWWSVVSLCVVFLCACGASTPEPTTTPEPEVVSPEAAAEVAPPRYSALALGFDGACVIDGTTPVCWGDFFELFDHARPRRVAELEGARKVAISAGMTACALMADGLLRCFGAYNESERLEGAEQAVQSLEASMEEDDLSDEQMEELERQIEAIEASLQPTDVAEDVRDVVVYDGGGCYLTDDVVRCWNEEDREEGERPPEQTIGADGEIVQIDSASSHRCLLQSNGRVRCWGYGEGLGWIHADEDEEPDQPGLTLARDAVEIAVGEELTCYRREAGSVACWGAIADSMSPEHVADGDYGHFEVPGIQGATRIAAGDEHVCVIVAEGRVMCWGDNSHGALGTGNTEPVEGVVEVPALSPARDIALGQGATCALVGEEIRCVGSNRYSVFGTTPTEEPQLFPVRGTRALTPGYRTCVENNGELTCTGGVLAAPVGRNMQLGAFDESDSRAVSALEGYIAYQCVLRDTDAACGTRGRDPRNLSNVEALSVGTTSSCVLESNRRVQCWRNRDDSRDHTDLLTRHVNPTVIPGVTRAQSLDVGDVHACVVRTDGRVTCWGDNTRGLIQTPAGELTAPVELADIRDAVQVNLNRSSTCVRKRDQTLHCRTTSDWRQIDLTHVVDVVARGYERYVLTAEHRVYRLRGNTPEPVELPAEIVEISAGTAHTCARARDGRVWCWGIGEHGELGVLPSWIHLEPLTVELGH